MQSAAIPFVGQTPLVAAVYGAHCEIVRELVAAGADVDQPESSGDTPVLIATLAGSTAAVQLLAEEGADLETAKEHMTPLSIAASNGYLGLVWVLVAAGAVINTAAAADLSDPEEFFLTPPLRSPGCSRRGAPGSC